MAAIVIKLGSAFFSFVIVFIVARESGAAVTGDYAIALATSQLLALVAVLGLDQILTRAIGGDLREGRPDLARAALMAVVPPVGLVAGALAIITYVAAPLATFIDAPPAAMRAVALSVFAFPLLRIAVVSLRAAGALLVSQILDGAHSLLMLSVIGCLVVIGDVPIDAVLLAALYSGAVVLSMVLAWALLRQRTRSWPKGAENTSPLLSRSWPVLLSAVGHSFTNWFVLAAVGAIMVSADVGAFRVANQIVLLIAMMVATVETLVNPQLAGDFRAGDIAGAWRRHRRTSFIMLLAAAAPVALCLLFPRTILSLFGPEFAGASTALMILAGGQLANIATGPIGGIMIMSGHERLSLQLSMIGLVIAVALCVTLVPSVGLVGAASAIAVAMIARNAIAYIVMRRRLPVR